MPFLVKSLHFGTLMRMQMLSVDLSCRNIDILYQILPLYDILGIFINLYYNNVITCPVCVCSLCVKENTCMCE